MASPALSPSIPYALEQAYDFWDWWAESDTDRSALNDPGLLRAVQKTTNASLPEWAQDTCVADIIVEGTRVTSGGREGVLNAAIVELVFDWQASEDPAVNMSLHEDLLVSDPRTPEANRQDDLDAVFNLARLLLSVTEGQTDLPTSTLDY